MSQFNESSTYHSGENNHTTGREPFEDTSRDFIHGGGSNAHAIPGTFGAGVGNTTSTTTHHTTGAGLTGATAGAGLTGRGRRGSNSSSSSSSDEDDGQGGRRRKTVRTKNKKPIGEKIKEAVGMGGASAGTGAVSGVAASHQGQHDSRGMAPGTAGVSGVHQGASHGLHSLHGQRDEFNDSVDVRQTGDVAGGYQSGTQSYGTGHNLASEARDHTTGSHHTGTGVGAAGLAGAAASHLPGQGQYGSNTSASNYASTTEHSHGLGHSGSNIGEDRSAGYARNTGGPGNQGITGTNLSGAAGTDRFDVDRASSGVAGIGSGTHQDSGVGRHGVTGDFGNNATAPTGGAYSNADAKTGLTGREHTSTGVPDQHGNSTEQHASGGILGKVKAVLGGH